MTLVYDYRWPADGRFGVLKEAVNAGATTLRSFDFQQFTADLSPSYYRTIIITDDTPYKYEIVWATGHTIGSDTVTVVRGREGTTAQSWPANAVWRHGPTIRDTVGVTTRAGLSGLTDHHMGARYALSDEEQTLVKSGGTWQNAAPYRPSRKQMWTQLDYPLSDDNPVIVSGWDEQVAGPEIAVMAANGNCTLNLEGVWSITAMMRADEGTTQRTQHFQINWPSGPWAATVNLFTVKDTSQVAYTWCGLIQQPISWCGYVTAAQAAAPFQIKCYQNTAPNLMLLTHFYLIVEYLGL